MKNLINFMITFMLTTTFCFSKTFEMNELNNISDQIDSMSEFNLVPEKSKLDGHSNKTMRRLDREISKAKIKNEKLEDTVTRLSKEMDYLFAKRSEKVGHILEKELRLKRHYKKALKNNPELTLAEYKDGLERSIDPSENATMKSQVLKQVRASGSYAKFLEDYKLSVQEQISSIGGRAPSSIDWDLVLGVLVFTLIIGVVVALGFWIGWSIVGPILIGGTVLVVGSLVAMTLILIAAE